MDRVKIFAKVTSGKLEIYNKKLYAKYIEGIPDGTDVELKIRVVNNRRSEEQNNYYWLILRFIANEVGVDSPEEMHKHFKEMYISGKSTTDLSPKEFADYIQKVVIYASVELNMTLPSPPEKD